jgi:O-antigen/teichoic acid export membrane protein
VDAKPRFKRNVVSNWSAFLFTAVVAFFLSPFVVRSLGNSEYGAWVLLGSLVGYMGLLDLGVRGAVTRFIAKFHAEGDHHQSSQLASSAFFIFCISGLIATVVAVFLAVVVVPAFRIPEELIAKAKVVVIIGGVTIAVTLINGVFEGIIVGRQRFDYTSRLTIAAEGLRAVLVVLALRAGEGLIALAIIQLGIGALRASAAYVIGRRLYPEAQIRFAHWDRQSVRMIFSFSIYVVFLQASGTIIAYTDSLVISAFLPIGLLTFFAIAVNLTTYARAIVRGISFTLMPMSSALEAQGKIPELRRIILKSARLSTLVILPIVITFIIRGGSFIGLWMGPKYAELSGHVLWILAIGLAAHGGFGSVASTMYGLNRHKDLIPIFLTEAVVNLALSIWLVQTMGIIGVAWGTVIPRLFVSLVALPWQLRRVLGVGLPTFWNDAWVRPVVSMIPFAVATYIIQQTWLASNLVMFFSQVAVALPLAAIGGWYFCLTTGERQTYGHALAMRLGRSHEPRSDTALSKEG